MCFVFSFSGFGEAFKWMPELESPCIYLRRYVEHSHNAQHFLVVKLAYNICVWGLTSASLKQHLNMEY